MISPSALMAAPLAAASLTLPPARPIDPADLWSAGLTLTAEEFSCLLEECTWRTLEQATEDGETVFYLVDPCGDRDGLPWFDLADAVGDLAPMIDEALCHE